MRRILHSQTVKRMIFSPGQTEKMSDSQLLGLYLETGRVDYFGELYNRYMPMVYGLCLKYLRNTESAEDAVMQIFEDLIPRIERYQIKEFRTWIYSVAKNHCFQELRKQQKEIPSDFTNVFMESDDFLHLLSKQDNERRLEALEKCLEQLPAPQRESITLFFMEEKSYADIADITKWQLKSIKSFIQNGKRNLKICIEAQ